MKFAIAITAINKDTNAVEGFIHKSSGIFAAMDPSRGFWRVHLGAGHAEAKRVAGAEQALLLIYLVVRDLELS